MRSNEVSAAEGIQSAVGSCFSSLCNVVGWDVGELWSLGPNSLSLLHVFVSEIDTFPQTTAGTAQEKMLSAYVSIINEYHSGARQNRASRSLCKRALRSRRGFYWRCSKRSSVVDSDVPFRSAMAFHMPRDNINGDVFIVLFSLKYLSVRSFVWPLLFLSSLSYIHYFTCFGYHEPFIRFLY
jgi:hypothetical protein